MGLILCVLVFISRTPALNLMPHVALRIPSGAPLPNVAWPRLLPPVGCHRTRNCLRVPLTYQPASTAHLVTILSMLVHMQAHLGLRFLRHYYEFGFAIFPVAGGKGTPSSSTPAAASPPPSLSDEFLPVSLPRSTASPPCKVLLWRMTFCVDQQYSLKGVVHPEMKMLS